MQHLQFLVNDLHILHKTFKQNIFMRHSKWKQKLF